MPVPDSTAMSDWFLQREYGVRFEWGPTGARQLVDFKDPKDPVHDFLRENKVTVLKPNMATEAKVYYKNLDGSVR